MTLSKLPSQAWKHKEVSEQRLPLQPYVGLVVFNDVSRYCFFHSNILSISVQGRLLLHWFLPTFASEGFAAFQVRDFRLCFGGGCVGFFQKFWALQLYKWGSSPNVNHYLTLTYLKSLVTTCLKSDIAICGYLWLWSLFLAAATYQMRLIQSSLLVLWGEKLLVYL